MCILKFFIIIFSWWTCLLNIITHFKLFIVNIILYMMIIVNWSASLNTIISILIIFILIVIIISKWFTKIEMANMIYLIFLIFSLTSTDIHFRLKCTIACPHLYQTLSGIIDYIFFNLIIIYAFRIISASCNIKLAILHETPHSTLTRFYTALILFINIVSSIQTIINTSLKTHI